MKKQNVFGCKTCGKKVYPKKGRLICCGHNEPIPGSNPNLCQRCGGYKSGAMTAFGECICIMLWEDEGEY